MKIPNIKQICRLLSTFVVIGMVESCSNEYLVDGSSERLTGELSLILVDCGYSSTDVLSRAIERDYTTTFAPGDKIGFYSVKNGALIAANICLTAKAGIENTLLWEPPTDVILWNFADHFFVYYPYQTNLSGAIDPAATDANTFFANVITTWTPNANQSSQTNYTSQDLMVGKGILNQVEPSSGKHPLNVTLEHKMGLAIISIPSDATNILFDQFSPISMGNNSYRYLIKPETETTLGGRFTQGGKERQYSIKAKVVGNKYNTYNVVAKITKD